MDRKRERLEKRRLSNKESNKFVRIGIQRFEGWI